MMWVANLPPVFTYFSVFMNFTVLWIDKWAIKWYLGTQNKKGEGSPPVFFPLRWGGGEVGMGVLAQRGLGNQHSNGENIKLVCLCVCLCMACMPGAQEASMGCRISCKHRAYKWVTMSVLALNPGPLQKQLLHLTTESIPPAPKCVFLPTVEETL